MISNDEFSDSEVMQPLLRRRRNLPSIALKLIPTTETNQCYAVNADQQSEAPVRNPKCVTIMSNDRYSAVELFCNHYYNSSFLYRQPDNSILAGESSYQSSCESDVDGHSSIASPSYKVYFYISLYSSCIYLILV